MHKIIKAEVLPPQQDGDYPFLYRCPNTGLRVQGWSAEEVPTDEANIYETLICTACQRVHLVNPGTGNVLAGDEDR